MKHLNKEQKERKEYFYGKIDALKNKTYKYDFDKLIKDYAAVNKVTEEHKAELL